MFCCTLLNAHSSIAIILMGKRELVALLNYSSWCLVMVELDCLRFVIVVFPDHTHLLYSCPMKTHHSSDVHRCGLSKAVQNCVIYIYYLGQMQWFRT